VPTSSEPADVPQSGLAAGSLITPAGVVESLAGQGALSSASYFVFYGRILRIVLPIAAGIVGILTALGCSPWRAACNA